MLIKYDIVVYNGVLFKRYKQRKNYVGCMSCDKCFWLRCANCTRPPEVDINCVYLDNSEYYYRPCYYAG